MKLSVAFDNLAKFFDEDNDTESAPLPSEIFRDGDGKLTEIRIYNVEYEQLIIIDRSGNVEALSVDEYEKSLKFNTK